MSGISLQHDWFPRALPLNVALGERSWLYSAFAFLHCRSRRPCAVRIGRDSGVYNGSFFDLGPRGEVVVGDYCTLVGAVFACNSRVVIGDYVFVAHEVTFADGFAAAPGAGPDGEGEPPTSIVLGENSWVGARAVLLAGARVGAGAIIGAATVVDFEVPPYAVVAGNPARVVGELRPLMTDATVTVLCGFDDPGACPATWEALATAERATHTVFQTWHWLSAWWDSFGRGELLLLRAERAGRPVAIAPLFADGGMAFFIGSGGSDYLDFVGDASDRTILDAILRAAREGTPGFVGFRFYLVPDDSPTGARLGEAAGRLGLVCHDEGDLPAPALALHDPPGGGLAAAAKASLVRHEKYFRREGDLDVLHLRDGSSIVPHLDDFFDQHVARWSDTPYPSLFHDAAQRRFYRRLCEVAGAAGWLRFTRLTWGCQPIAYHFGFSHAGRYLWYKPSFAVELARQSPGEVLLRQLLLAAAEEGAGEFDFGLGDEAFKRRFANRTRRVRTWGLYPREG